ncbi:cell division protein FtsZ [Limibacillus halophilus]|uniref:Cell division protein FtsZ n=1 Tax=Limibacillus halophilus TaxID=1579333 RepID=A0A839SSZ7_9PROT|nr:cell division protein FtsZ [Limibacillus halophilus]MBB3064840.1 cell division protein FtsZ [Limibacillus halophilus]
MSLNLSVPKDEQDHLKPRITVVGVGGAGGNAVNNMISSKLEGVEFVIANTDAQALEQSICERRIQLGRHITSGLGAGSRPDVGRAAAEEAMDEILENLEGSNMVFITAGMGGGTGTGAAPVIARAARENGILTVGVVTKPFQFEGIHRMRMAESGLDELQQFVDTLIIIPNQNLFRVCDERTTFADAFKMADDVLHSGVRGVTDLMIMPGLINLDFADIRTVMSEMGKAMMGTGESEGDGRAIAASEAAISNPLLDDVSMRGARGVLINITGGMDMTLFEVDEAANRIREEVDPDANIIFGSTFDESMNGIMRVSIVATGIDADEAQRPVPISAPVAKAKPRVAPLVAEEERVRPAAAAFAQEQEAADANLIAAVAAIEEPQEQFDEQGTELPEPVVAEVESQEPVDERIPELAVAEAGPELAVAGQHQDAFIPPKPMEAPRRPRIQEQARRTAEPFAEAAMANGSNEAASQRRSNIFNKMTKAALAFTGVERKEEAATLREVPTAGRQEAEPKLASSRREPQVHRTEAKPEAAAGQQANLSGLDSRAQPAESEFEDDLFEIPTFLRRQAN